jgi:hypothetical protein
VSSAALEERAQDLQAQRAWISRCSTSRASLNLMPVDNERKHGGVAEPIRRLTGDVNLEEEKKFSN